MSYSSAVEAESEPDVVVGGATVPAGLGLEVTATAEGRRAFVPRTPPITPPMIKRRERRKMA
jgi:hypothetical protein